MKQIHELIEDLQVLLEVRNYRQLSKQTSHKIKERANKVVVRKITKTKQGKHIFQTGTKGVSEGKYRTWIRPLYPRKSRDVLKDDVIVYCSCPYFKFFLEVSDWKGDASQVIQSNGKLPKITNPGMRKYLCKHLVAAFQQLEDKKMSGIKKVAEELKSMLDERG